jgi:hypothetical protein
MIWDLVTFGKLFSQMKAMSTFLFVVWAATAVFGQAEEPGTNMLLRYEHFFQKQTFPVDRYTFDDAAINAQLLKAIKHQRQQKMLFIGGGVLFVAGVLLMLSSASSASGGVHSSGSISHVVDRDLRSGRRQLGAISLGASVPILFIGSNQVSRRDRAMEEAKHLLKNSN